jgi:hypothetical protein
MNRKYALVDLEPNIDTTPGTLQAVLIYFSIGPLLKYQQVRVQ